MAISWNYHIPPHEVAQWPVESIRRTLGWARYQSEQMEKESDRDR